MVAGVVLDLAMALAVNGPLQAGLILAGARVVRGRGSVRDPFLGFRRYPDVLVAEAVGRTVAVLSLVAGATPGALIISTTSSG